MNGDEFGPLTGLVGTVGSIFAAGVAIALTWRGRARWEPSETDIAKGPERVGGLVTAVLIVILFVVTRPQGSVGLLPVLAILLLVVCVASLLAYSYITGTNTYDDAKRDRKIIGGFKLTPRAKREMRARKLTEQRFFGTVDFDPDEVWPRSSRSLAKLVFVALYLLLVVSGTVAIAAAAILIEKQGTAPAPTASPNPPRPPFRHRGRRRARRRASPRPSRLAHPDGRRAHAEMGRDRRPDDGRDRRRRLRGRQVRLAG